jgi:Zn-dependent protease with chaperone function
MSRFAWILLGACLLILPAGVVGHSQTGSSPIPPAQHVSETGQDRPTQPPATTAYTLTPEQRARAIAYSRSQYVLYFLETLVSLGIYFFLWRAGVALTFRQWARKVSRRRFVQCLIFVPLFAAAVALLNLPIEFYSSYVLEHRFGLATQGLASWFSDWGRSLAVVIAIGIIVAWIFYTTVLHSPRRWWFYFWLASIPLVLAFILVEPYAIEPLFYHFTPLQKTQPALVERIEAMLNHAGLSIPAARILEMDASSRTRVVNAYVSGLGASKRVVVWDTTLKTMAPDELLLVLGHETGHYVLHHIPKEFVLDEAVALLFFFLGFLAVSWLVEKAGPRFGIEGTGDLASLPLVLVVLTLLVFLSDPLVNAISRHYEHQADQFGLEVAYGIVPDPNAAEAHALQILGEEDLEDPDPNPFVRLWLYTHPPLDDRIRFAAAYKPWTEKKQLELLPHRR